MGIHWHGLFGTCTEVNIKEGHDPHRNRSVNENGKIYPYTQLSHQQGNSRPVLARSILTSWITIQYRIELRPPFHSKVLGGPAESTGCGTFNVNCGTPPD